MNPQQSSLTVDSNEEISALIETLLAREMGGSLAAHSDGSGLGAVFTLELPSEPSRRESADAERRAIE